MFDMERVRKGVRQWTSEMKDNRLVSHLSHCALTYGCPAALNMFLSREEGPLVHGRVKTYQKWANEILPLGRVFVFKNLKV